MITGLVCSCLLGQGCSGDVSKVYRINTGEEPQYQDENVRFRTTYYLRVFDVCPVSPKEEPTRYESRMNILRSLKDGKIQVVKDSLYRFRMTGKASAYFSNMRFESGVLRANQVDPFGATFDYDEENNKFRLPDAQASPESDLSPNKPAGSENSGGKTQNSGPEYCPIGDPARQVFMLLGPEGVKVLDRSDRLVMAMYSDSKPLISMLKQLSGNQVNGAQSIFQGLGEEHARLSRVDEWLAAIQTGLGNNETEARYSPEALRTQLDSMLADERRKADLAKTLGNRGEKQ